MNGIDASKKNDNLVLSSADDCTCKVRPLSSHQALLWDSRSGDVVKTLPHSFQVTSCCFNEDTTQIITGGLDGVIRVARCPPAGA